MTNNNQQPTHQNMPQPASTGLQVVVGLGITGLSVVQYLLAQGLPVAVTDSRENPPNADELPSSVQASFGQLDAALLMKAARIIISPGLSLETPEVVAAKDAGISVVGDVHLLGEAVNAMHTPVPIVAITGSNAKSTVTTLVGNMATKAGKKVAVGGNLGRPALALLQDNPALIVLETSSFQLESTTDLAPAVASILNMSADHLDRHHTMQGYQTAKQRIFQGAKAVVINRDDALTLPTPPAQPKKILSFGLNQPSTAEDYGLAIDQENNTYIVKGDEKIIAANDLKIKGQHNLLNAQAALALGELAGLPLDAMLAALSEFTGLPHRCEYVANVAGIDYFNDSKGTNVGSTLAAINGLGASYQSTGTHKKLFVILGGEGKGQDFSELTTALATYAKAVLLIGADAAKIAQHVPSTVSKHMVENIANAVQHVKQHASRGDVLLLSPACASFDQFANYVQRGEHFVALVRNT